MKKLLVAILVVALALMGAVVALAETAPTPAPSVIGTWAVTVITAEGEVPFTNEDAALLEPVTLEATTKNKNGEEKTSTYTGIKLSDILVKANVTEFTSLTVTAADDFAAEYDKELALKEDTLLAWEKNGELMEGDQPVQMVPTSGTGNQFVKNALKITVNP